MSVMSVSHKSISAMQILKLSRLGIACKLSILTYEMPGDRSVASEFNNGVILHIPNGTEGQGTEGRVPVS